MRNYLLLLLIITLTYSCGGGRMGTIGGELTGVPTGRVWDEPTPYNMVLVSRGAYTMGPGEIDSLWGINIHYVGVHEIVVTAEWAGYFFIYYRAILSNIGCIF